MEPRIYYPEDYQPDEPLEAWLSSHASYPTEPVVIAYYNRQACIVPRNNLVNKQQYLSDGRLLRCDWSSPRRKDQLGSRFVSVEAMRNMNENLEPLNLANEAWNLHDAWIGGDRNQVRDKFKTMPPIRAAYLAIVLVQDCFINKGEEREDFIRMLGMMADSEVLPSSLDHSKVRILKEAGI